MKIMIAGPGCSRCHATEKVVRQVCEELGLKAEVEHNYDVKEYAQLGIRLTPAVLIDGNPVFSGRVPSVDDLKSIFSSGTSE